MEKMEDLVGIYRQEQDAKTEPPAYYLTREEARTLKKLNQGFFINHGRDLRLLEHIENVMKLAEEQNIVFRNPYQSRQLKPKTIDEAVRQGIRPRHKIASFDFMRGRLRPLAVVAVECWA